jgi:hypothetical protein
MTHAAPHEVSGPFYMDWPEREESCRNRMSQVRDGSSGTFSVRYERIPTSTPGAAPSDSRSWMQDAATLTRLFSRDEQMIAVFVKTARTVYSSVDEV